ncbi:MAG TPA: histidinol-phosphate transaminase [Verrucomicrobiae bacterium]|nr:histidinol-phosphate transaminase [Verrucomicrobiae bacterium]
MNPAYKSYVEDIHPYKPGKPIKEVERELGLRNVIKLASNENPLGPSRKALWAMRRAIREAHLYPEGSGFYLVKRLEQELGIPTSQILIGNGSNEILELLSRGFLSPGDQIISSQTSFLVYPILAKACGADFVEVPMKDFRYDLEGILKAVTDKTKIIFIANPNNPTGTYVTDKEVAAFLAKVPPHVIVCFDEAYVDFVDAHDFPRVIEYVQERRPNVIVMRTFSKSYGLAGLRIGYAAGDPKMIGYLHKVRQPFNVNSIAQAAATAALDDRFFLWRTKHCVTAGRRFFYRRFDLMGLKYLPSQANFVLVDTGCDGDEVFQALLKQGMIIRSMKEYGLQTWIRVSIGRRSQNAQFIRLLKSYLRKGI